jgi:C-terminal processing protease CtpA/Prc
VVEAAAQKLETQYVFPEQGQAMAVKLRAQLRQGAYDGLDGEALAQRLTQDLQALTGDGHLRVEHSAQALAEDDAQASAEYDAKERERYYGAHLNFGFEKAERLDGNIGLLELRVFAPVDLGGDTAAAAMRFLAHTDALIVDLRRNGGGDGDMANLLAAYLFDGGSKPISGFYSRPENETTQRWTQPYVPGPRYGERKPVYVLTSRKTFSAAEAFTYDLKALKRAAVVGEPTGGGAHPFEYKKLHPHFVLWLVTGRSVNPITGSNWQGTGVQPDVAVPAEEALDRALVLAREGLKAGR